eukprot:613704_1
MYKHQNNQGYYSHIPLNPRPLSDWQVSLERLDPSCDYVLGNMVLEALEFNSRCQWNVEKIVQIPSLIRAPPNITLHDLNDAQSAQTNKLKKRPKFYQKALFHN